MITLYKNVTKRVATGVSAYILSAQYKYALESAYLSTLSIIYYSKLK